MTFTSYQNCEFAQSHGLGQGADYMKDTAMEKLLFVALLLLLSFEANAATPIYSQPPIPGGSTLLQSSGNGNDYDRFVWDNFTLSSTQDITRIDWRGGYDLTIAAAGFSGPVLDFSVAIWGSIGAGTQPDIGSGPLVLYDSIGGTASETLVGTFGSAKMYDYSYVLPTPFHAAAGTKYWVQIKAFQSGVPDWGFAAATGGDGHYFGSYVNYAGGTSYVIRSGDSAFTLLTSPPPPSAPILAPEPAFTSGTTNRPSWNSVAGASQYYLEWSQSSLFAPVTGNSGWTTATSCLVTALADGQTYYSRAKCRDVLMVESGWSNVVSSRQDASPPTVPGAPTDTGAYTSATTVQFYWAAAADAVSGVASHDLQVGTAPGASNVFNASMGTALTRTVTGSNGQTLYARVRARDNVGNIGAWSANSDGILVDTAVPTAPGRPTDAGAFTSSTSVRFTWTAASDPGTNSSGLASYRLQVTSGGLTVSGRWVGNATSSPAAGSNGQRLVARVCARDRAGNVGLWSSPSDGITVDTAKPRLTGLTVRDARTLEITFGEPVVNADQNANYTCAKGLGILAVQALSATQYRLSTTDQHAGTSCTLTVKDSVRDRAGNPMDPAFSSRSFTGGVTTGVGRWNLYR